MLPLSNILNDRFVTSHKIMYRVLRGYDEFGVPSYEYRVLRGYGSEADRLKELARLPEFRDCQNYDRDTSQIAKDLRKVIGTFNLDGLKVIAREVAALTGKSCRDEARKEAFLVKWLLDRIHVVRSLPRYSRPQAPPRPASRSMSPLFDGFDSYSSFHDATRDDSAMTRMESDWHWPYTPFPIRFYFEPGKEM
jgi:hypothetical protein